MDMIAAYNDVGSYRGAAAICGVDPWAQLRPRRRRSRQGVTSTRARISAERLLPVARAAGYLGSAPQLPAPLGQGQEAWRADNRIRRGPGASG
jgi:hypothetical protein